LFSEERQQYFWVIRITRKRVPMEPTPPQNPSTPPAQNMSLKGTVESIVLDDLKHPGVLKTKRSSGRILHMRVFSYFHSFKLKHLFSHYRWDFHLVAVWLTLSEKRVSKKRFVMQTKSEYIEQRRIKRKGSRVHTM
jgi:hypothetical protein